MCSRFMPTKRTLVQHQRKWFEVSLMILQIGLEKANTKLAFLRSLQASHGYWIRKRALQWVVSEDGHKNLDEGNIAESTQNQPLWSNHGASKVRLTHNLFFLLPIQSAYHRWYCQDFKILPPYAATGNRTHVGSVAPPQGTFFITPTTPIASPRTGTGLSRTDPGPQEDKESILKGP